MQNVTKQEKYLQLHRIKKNILFILLEIFIEITMELICQVSTELLRLMSKFEGFEAGLILP